MSVFDRVGNTPLVELKNLGARHVSLFAKAEFGNPSGSVKDRAAAAMILEGIERGLLVKGKTMIDATSGNTGIAYAMLGAALGFPVALYMPQNTSQERKQIIRCYGAEIVETSPLEGSDGAFEAVRIAVAADPEKYFYPDQYNNPANPNAHFTGTGVEILRQTGGGVTHFVAGMGTSGTFVGVSRRLKQDQPGVKTFAVQPASPLHGIEGTKHMASTIRPGILDESLIDRILTVTTEEAYEMTRRLARQEGLFAGISSGGNVAASLKLAETLPPGSVVVTILCDSGSRYVSDPFWEA
ncbi:MAG: PLP-dependent cysteine synthase family protein [Peptococcaceae bacterium]|jgi:cysteine synthase B|nr:PLP-dependent cysteine synthase family protein [Peptococcaceae bacterium]